jgi:hypothetical protein
MGRRSVILALLVAACAGCGGESSSEQSVPVYRQGPTETCLRNHGYAIRHSAKAVGFIAFASVGGSLRATKRRDADVILAFGNDGNAARQTLDAVRRNPKIANSAIFRYRIRKANVVAFWVFRPKQQVERVVYGCLRPPAA